MLVHDRHTTGVLIGAKTMYIDISTKSKIKLPYEVDKCFMTSLNEKLFKKFKKKTIQTIDYCIGKSISPQVLFKRIEFELQLSHDSIIQITLDYQSIGSFVWNYETTRYYENFESMKYFQRKESMNNSIFWMYDSYHSCLVQVSQDKALRLIKNNYYLDFEITNN